MLEQSKVKPYFTREQINSTISSGSFYLSIFTEI